MSWESSLSISGAGGGGGCGGTSWSLQACRRCPQLPKVQAFQWHDVNMSCKAISFYMRLNLRSLRSRRLDSCIRDSTLQCMVNQTAGSIVLPTKQCQLLPCIRVN